MAKKEKKRTLNKFVKYKDVILKSDLKKIHYENFVNCRLILITLITILFIGSSLGVEFSNGLLQLFFLILELFIFILMIFFVKQFFKNLDNFIKKLKEEEEYEIKSS